MHKVDVEKVMKEVRAQIGDGDDEYRVEIERNDDDKEE